MNKINANSIKHTRYKIEFIVDTILTEEKIAVIIGAFDGYMIRITEDEVTK